MLDAHMGGFDRTVTQAKAEAHKNLGKFEDRVQWIEKKGCDAAVGIKDASQDFVFVDGSHFYEDVLADITAWWPKIRPGGRMIGHDWGGRRNRTGEYGVDRAVVEYFGDHEYRVVGDRSRMWYADVRG